MKYPDGLIFDESNESEYQIVRNDPQSARICLKRSLKYYYEDSSWNDILIESESTMFTKDNPSTFQVHHHLFLTNNQQVFFDKKWNLSFPRQF